MRIGIIGATGGVGSLIMKEALERGHEVTALVREPGKITDSRATVRRANLFALKTEDLYNYDVLVDAFNAARGHEELHLRSIEHLIAIMIDEDRDGGLVPVRLYVVGHAGTLYTDPDHSARLLESADFDEDDRRAAENMAAGLEKLRTSPIQWTYITPPRELDPEGRRTGEYTLGGEELLKDSQGRSTISYADYAAAFLDIIESGSYDRQRVSIRGGR